MAGITEILLYFRPLISIHVPAIFKGLCVSCEIIMILKSGNTVPYVKLSHGQYIVNISEQYIASSKGLQFNVS